MDCRSFWFLVEVGAQKPNRMPPSAPVFVSRFFGFWFSSFSAVVVFLLLGGSLTWPGKSGGGTYGFRGVAYLNIYIYIYIYIYM